MKNKTQHIFILTTFSLVCMTTQLSDENSNKWKEKILKNPEIVNALIADGTITTEQIPNPHWREDACDTCHAKEATVENLQLKNKNNDQFCNFCHSTLASHNYIHPTEIEISKEIFDGMGTELRESIRRSKGKLSCISCHDLSRQCLQRESYHKSVNPSFLRGDSYKSRTEICYQCHTKSAYQKLNPHIQIVDDIIKKENCGICHRTVANLFNKQSIDNIDFNISEDYSKMCINCHINRPHPGSGFTFDNKSVTTSHLVKLTKEMTSFLSEQQITQEVELPLEPNTNKIYCGTCHNPHQEGITTNSALSMSINNKDGLRNDDVCSLCHDI